MHLANEDLFVDESTAAAFVEMTENGDTIKAFYSEVVHFLSLFLLLHLTFPLIFLIYFPFLTLIFVRTHLPSSHGDPAPHRDDVLHLRKEQGLY